MRNTCNYAAIDIGSNAVRLLIKRVNEDEADELFTKELLLRVPLRLGQDSFTIGEISEGKAKKLLRLIKAFRQLMKIYDVVDYRACATSAMRDARNGKEITKMIHKNTGIQIEVIDGQEEARIVYDNHIENQLSGNANYIYVDVGGGSTEIALISGGGLISSKSYNVGTVRMLNNSVREEELAVLRKDISELSELYNDLIIIGSGGNINKLFRLVDEKDKKASMFTVEALRKLHTELNQYTIEQRRKLFNLKRDRAEVIIPASEIFLDVANCSKSTQIWVPTIGLADGIIDSLYTKNRETTEKEKEVEKEKEKEKLKEKKKKKEE